MGMKCSKRFFIVFSLLFLVSSPMLFGQGQDIQSRDRQLDKLSSFDAERHLTKTTLESSDELLQDVEFQAGGVFRYTIRNFYDGELEHTLRNYDLRVWANMVYQNTHQLFVQVMGEIKDYNKGTQFFYEEENDMDAPRMDVAYYQGNITQLLGLSDVGVLKLKVGRENYTIGEGLVIDRRGDGAQLEYTLGDWNIMGFMMRSVKSEDNVDRSHPDFGHDKRLYSAIGTSYDFLPEFEVFAYTAWQRDKNKDYYPDLFGNQKFGHDEFYAGGGIRGEIGPSFTYKGEYVRQKGHRYSRDSIHRASVRASAYNIKTEYTFRTVQTTPKLFFQFVKGTGDGDTINNLDTFYNNNPTSGYDAFTSFGFVHTGLVFSPMPSNMKVFSGGASCKLMQFESNDCDLDLGVIGHQYYRVRSHGGITDRFTSPGQSFLGRGFDVIAQYRPFSDLTVLLQYGAFYPDNDPFPDNSNRDYKAISFIIYF